MDLQESDQLFNTERLDKKREQAQLEEKKLSAFEAQLSMNQSKAISSEELLDQKNKLMQEIEEIEKSFDSAREVLENFKQKINVVEKMKSIHQKNNQISKENFAFLKEFLLEHHIIRTKEAKNTSQLYDEITTEKVVRQSEQEDQKKDHKKEDEEEEMKETENNKKQSDEEVEKKVKDEPNQQQQSGPFALQQLLKKIQLEERKGFLQTRQMMEDDYKRLKKEAIKSAKYRYESVEDSPQKVQNKDQIPEIAEKLSSVMEEDDELDEESAEYTIEQAYQQSGNEEGNESYQGYLQHWEEYQPKGFQLYRGESQSRKQDFDYMKESVEKKVKNVKKVNIFDKIMDRYDEKSEEKVSKKSRQRSMKRNNRKKSESVKSSNKENKRYSVGKSKKKSAKKGNADKSVGKNKKENLIIIDKRKEFEEQREQWRMGEKIEEKKEKKYVPDFEKKRPNYRIKQIFENRVIIESEKNKKMEIYFSAIDSFLIKKRDFLLLNLIDIVFPLQLNVSGEMSKLVNGYQFWTQEM